MTENPPLIVGIPQGHLEPANSLAGRTRLLSAFPDPIGDLLTYLPLSLEWRLSLSELEIL